MISGLALANIYSTPASAFGAFKRFKQLLNLIDVPQSFCVIDKVLPIPKAKTSGRNIPIRFLAR